jgi:hypothetical protein
MAIYRRESARAVHMAMMLSGFAGLGFCVPPIPAQGVIRLTAQEAFYGRAAGSTERLFSYRGLAYLRFDHSIVGDLLLGNISGIPQR